MKPFNIEHAAAGAPVRLSCGTEQVRILATDARSSHPVVALVTFGSHDSIGCFKADGTAQSGGVGLSMAPIATVQGREVYMGDTLLSLPSRTEYIVGTAVLPPFDFTWPREYPMTEMGEEELIREFSTCGGFAVDGYLAIANAAIAHGIEHGYLAEPAHMASDDELIKAYYHPVPPPPMTPNSYDKMVECLRRVRDTVFKGAK